MNTPTLIMIATILLTLVVSFIVYNNKPRSATNLFFVAWAFISIPLLLVDHVSLQFTADLNITLWLIRLSMFCAVIQTTFFFIFTHTFPNDRVQMSKRNLIRLLLSSGLIALLTLTPLVFQGVSVINNSVEPIPNVGIVVFALFTICLVIGGIYTLVHKYQRAEDQSKNSLLLIIFGTVIMFGLFIILHFVLVVLFKVNFFIQYSDLFVLPYLFLSAYAITRHRLFSIRFILKQPTAQWLIIICAAVIFLLTWSVGYQLFSTDFTSLIIFTAVDFVVLISSTIYLLKRVMFTPEFDFSIPSSLDVAANTTTTLQTLVKQLDGVLQSKFQMQVSSLLVLNWQEQIYQSFQTTDKTLEKISLPRVHSLVYVMRTQPQFITLEQLQSKSDLSYSLQQDILQFFKKYNLVAVLPLLNDVDVYGFVVIPAAAVLPEDLASRKDDLINLSRKFGMVLQQILTYDALIKQL